MARSASQSMNNKQEREMMSKVANCEERGILIMHRTHESSQFNDESEANLLNCFRELTIGQVECDANAHTAITVYSKKVEEVDMFRACRKIKRGMSSLSTSASQSLSNRDIS